MTARYAGTADTVAGLVERAGAGDPRAVARLISLVESAGPDLRAAIALLAPRTSGAWVIGITGSPGVGKSTTTSALITAYRHQDVRVGVLAVDPSSPFSGGALLGDRVRMQEHFTDDGVFIRSMASRGHLGGLSVATPYAVRVLDAAGCQVVLVETVGVGQAELDVASLADSTVVLLAPGMGDGIQAAKAGLLEIADVFVVNKSDRDGAHHVVRELRTMLSLGGQRPAAEWTPPIVSTVASTGEGIEELVDRLDRHRQWLAATGELARRRQAHAVAEIVAVALARLRARLTGPSSAAALDALAARVAAGELDPYAAADELIAGLAQ